MWSNLHGRFILFTVLSLGIVGVEADCPSLAEDVLQCTGLPEIKKGDLNYTDIEYNVCL